MSLAELSAFLNALKNAEGIELSTVEPTGVTKLPTGTPSKPDKPRTVNMGRQATIDE